MTTAIDLGSIDLSSEKAVLSLNAVVDSLDGMERQLLSAAEKTDAGKASMERLGAAFLEGKINALQLRSGLQALVGEVPKAADEIRSLATATTDAADKGGRFKTAFANFSAGAGIQAAQQVIGNLVQETDELTRGLTGAAAAGGRIGQSILATLPAFGPYGMAVAGLVGAVGMFARVEREQQEAMRDTNRLHDSRARLGPMYNNIAAQIDATAAATGREVTAQERLNQTLEQERAIRSAQASMMTAADAARRAGGRNTVEEDIRRIRDLTNAADGLVPSIRRMNMGLHGNVTTQEVLAAVTSRNTGLLRQWGLDIQFGTNEARNHLVALAAVTRAREQSARATLASARAEAEAARRADLVATVSRRFATEDTPQMIEARARVSRATMALAAAERGLGEATAVAARAARDHAAALDAENAAAEEAKQKVERQAVSDRRAAAAAAAGHSAQEIRDLRQQIGLTIERTRGVVMQTRYIGLSISANRELTELEQRRARFEAQRHHTFAQRQRFLADLQREVELRQTLAEQERAIRDAVAEAQRTRDEAQRGRDRETAEAQITQERERMSRIKDIQGQLQETENARSRQRAETARQEAEAIRNGPIEMLKSAGQSLTSSLGGAFTAVVNGSKSVKAAVMEALQATMESLASESFGKALFEGASALAALAGGNIPSAVLHGKAAAGFAATAAVAGGLAAGGAALSSASSGSGASAGAGGATSSPSAGLPSGPRGGSDGAMAPITINYNAPVIGGRDAMAWETGARIGRYLGQADSRVRRAPALMGA